ncbi:HAD-IA family hydrolase [Rubrivirga sp. S365]|uniref:HAD-IA family hydrolase n=1 Tax=Rubrivirga litoralis TaxID=3075598 RepID=A0ABU3BMB2_9BACT|nr:MULTISPECIES: HAD-IA family hydrolase [unclassified Rubrivirga]MDT0630435.1 HAD-IA family hydrolase [Rubrivirga sp. F394]MDT7857586.1 HAD-IA family hydrolase [Rubrivirga sp. S365]
MPPAPRLRLLSFDLDGTLANTEQLKAESYAWAAHQLLPALDPADVEAAYPDYVGRSREEISRGLTERFALADAARARDSSVEPWEAYVVLRLERYRAMLADHALVGRYARPAAIALARAAPDLAETTALVTTSDRQNADAVLDALGLTGAFDTVVTADDVERTKPDPEGYRLALSRLGADASDALAVEDSPAGLHAALAAGIDVLAVPTDFTRDAIRDLVARGELGADAVTEPDELDAAVRRRVAQARRA